MIGKSNNYKGVIWLLIFYLNIMVISAQVQDSIFHCGGLYNNEDVTHLLQDALNSGAKKVIIPYMGPGTEWISGPLRMDDIHDMEILLEPGVILVSKSGSFPSNGTSFLTLKNCRNIEINGKGAEIEMLKHEYTDIGQWRHGISILSSDSILIDGIRISSTGGDGIYIATNRDTRVPSRNINIRNIVADQCARNGISIISCINLTIEDCNIQNTGNNNHPNNASNGPWAGIDLEPNLTNELLENVVINNCTIQGNRRYGILFAFGSEDCNVVLSNNKIYDNPYGISLIGKLRGTEGNILLKNNYIYGRQQIGLFILNWNHSNLQVDIEDTEIDNQQINVPVQFEISNEDSERSAFGNVSFKNTTFTNIHNTCLVYLVGSDIQNSFDNISFTGTSLSYKSEFVGMYENKSGISSYFRADSIHGENIFCSILEKSYSIDYYPNPFNEGFYIECDSHNLIDLKISDASGKIVQRTFARDGAFINCESLPKGEYIVMATDLVNQETVTKKIIKM